MLKKFLTAALITSMLILPVSSVTPSVYGEASAAGQSYLPGDVPAETDAEESMTPALHALVLAMLNHDADTFDFADDTLAWEGLYNMLSLYGQMDTRSIPEDGRLLMPEETVRDYAAALAVDPELLDSPPSAIWDRLNYDNVSRCYTMVCGEDGLAQVRVDSLTPTPQGCVLTGALVYQVDGRTLAKFQADLHTADSMFGYQISAVTIAA